MNHNETSNLTDVTADGEWVIGTKWGVFRLVVETQKRSRKDFFSGKQQAGTEVTVSLYSDYRLHFPVVDGLGVRRVWVKGTSRKAVQAQVEALIPSVLSDDAMEVAFTHWANPMFTLDPTEQSQREAVRDVFIRGGEGAETFGALLTDGLDVDKALALAGVLV